jgi:murein DD-endopeptidase MepM/ murein hydrolase activator NlpD
VKISKNVTVSMESVAPEKVMTVDETVQLLQKGSVSEEKYTVQKGDVLSTIAAKHGLKLKELLDLNPKVNEDTPLQIGDKLVVTVNQPYLDVIVQKEVRATEPVPYETKYIEDDAMYKGESKVVENGSDGERKRIYKVSEKNGKQVSKEVVQETIVKEPVTEVIRIGTKEIPSKGTGELIWPTKGGYISSKQGYRWGKMHKGIDIARSSDCSILAADNGTVVFAGEDGGYGNKVVIDHNNGMRTLYAHLSSIDVSVGQTVQKGSKIGIMGSTGNSTGIHLHFEVYQNNKLQNPLNYF